MMFYLIHHLHKLELGCILKASSLTDLETTLLFCVFCKSTKEARRTGSWIMKGKFMVDPDR
jgi:hypothetical protein